MPEKILYDWIDGGPDCSWKCMVRGIEEAKACPDYNKPTCFCAPEALAELHRNYLSVAKCLKELCDLEEELGKNLDGSAPHSPIFKGRKKLLANSRALGFGLIRGAGLGNSLPRASRTPLCVRAYSVGGIDN